MLSAYLKYAERHGLKTEILYDEWGKVGFNVLGAKASDVFKYETGKHVVQRCPPTENKGRRHTSVISVSILPIIIESNFSLLDKDIEIQTKRGGGPGGQHRNKTESCVHMKHIPTGITVTIDSRDQHANKREARRVLESRVQALQQEQLHNTISSDKRKQMDGGGRSNKIRTYNFIESRVTDHRLGTKTTQIRQVMRGFFDILFTDTDA